MKSVGVLGVGSIADAYVRNAARMRNFEIAAVAARDLDRARLRAAGWGVEALSVGDLLEREDIDVVLNLTPPAAHFTTTMAALAAGKHVYSEKPLGITVDEARALSESARQRGLRLGVAPDSLLGAGLQTARAMIDAGAIGRPLLATGSILYHGADAWHPNPAFFYRSAGGGPMHDVGPYFLAAMILLLGPVERVQATGLRGFEFRTVTAEGPEKGLEMPVEVPTTMLALLSFRSGAEATLQASWDVWQTSQPDLEVHGTEGSLSLPHPNYHGGPLKYARPGHPWETVPLAGNPLSEANWPPTKPLFSNYRGIGLAEMIRAMEDGSPHRTSAELATHVVEIADAALASAARVQPVLTHLEPATPLPFTPQDARDLVKDSGT